LFFMTFPELDIGAPRSETVAPVQGNGSANPNNTDVEGASNSRTVSSSSTALTPASSKPNLPPQPISINGVTVANLAPGLGADSIYEPRIYGFRVSERARTGPRMQWLRMKPADINELDEATRYREQMGVDEDGNPVEEVDDEGGEEGVDEGMPDASASQVQLAVPRRSSRRKDKSKKVNNNTTVNGGSPMEVVDGG
jgi:casein kinase II subunit beta